MVVTVCGFFGRIDLIPTMIGIVIRQRILGGLPMAYSLRMCGITVEGGVMVMCNMQTLNFSEIKFYGGVG